MTSQPSDYHSDYHCEMSISRHGCYLNIKLLLEYRKKPEFSNKHGGIVNYESICGISVEAIMSS